MATPITYNDNLQQPTESQASPDPFASALEIYGDNTFDLNNNPNRLLIAENLASEAKNLIIKLKSAQPWDIREKFQVELRKLNIHDEQCITYKMSLRIDPVLWFKCYAQNGSDVESFERLYENGRCYYEKVKSETERYFGIEDEDKIERLEFNIPSTEWCEQEQQGKICYRKNDRNRPCPRKHCQWCPDENYHSTGKCSNPKSCGYFHFSDFKNDVRGSYQCRYKSIQLDGKQVPCLFHANPNCRIYVDTVEKPSCCPYFIVSARPDATPVITLNPIRHCSNEEYVQTSDAWQAVLQTLVDMKNQLKLDKLPSNRINVNFGKWMSQKAGDSKRRHCHAHINIVLTRETIDKINNRNQSKDIASLFPSLVGSVLPPETNRLDDAWRLIKSMDSQMTPILFKENRELKEVVNTLKNNFEKLEDECKNLRQLISGTTHDGQEISEPANITDESDIGRGINDAIAMQESEQDSYPRWNRFLFAWNRT